MLTAMARDRDERFADARDFRLALQSSTEQKPPGWTSGPLLTGGPALEPSAGQLRELDEVIDESALVALDERESVGPSLQAASPPTSSSVPSGPGFRPCIPGKSQTWCAVPCARVWWMPMR